MHTTTTLRRVFGLSFLVFIFTASAEAQLTEMVFEDFEGVMAGSTVDMLTTTGGTWQDGGGAGVSPDPGVIQDAFLGPAPPASNGGSNYLRVADPARDSILDLDEAVYNQFLPGTEVLLEWDQYYISGFPQPFLLDNSNPVEGRGSFQYEFPIDGAGWCPGATTNEICYRNTAVERTPSGLIATPNTWEHFSFRNVIGSSEITMGLAENEVTHTNSYPLNGTIHGNGTIGQIWFTISSGADMLIDNLSLSRSGAAESPSSHTWVGNEAAGQVGFGDWSTGMNWTEPIFAPPNTAEVTAVFDDSSVTVPTTVAIAGSETVNGLEFNNATHSFILGGTGSLNFQASSELADPTIVNNGGSHELKVGVALVDNTSVDGGAGLGLSGPIDLGGKVLNTSGVVNIDHSVIDTIGGGSISNAGTLGTAGETPIAGGLTSTGTLDFDINGGQTGQSDVLNLTGAVSLDGTVNVDLLAGFIPAENVTLLTAAGGIDTPNGLPNLTGTGVGSFSLLVSNGTDLMLNVGVAPPVAGDYNQDGSIDAADYTVWRDSLGSNDALPNDGGLGTPISSLHYDFWKARFGASGSGTATAVPEPATGLLATLAMLFVVAVSRRVGRGSVLTMITACAALLLLVPGLDATAQTVLVSDDFESVNTDEGAKTVEVFTSSPVGANWDGSDADVYYRNRVTDPFGVPIDTVDGSNNYLRISDSQGRDGYLNFNSGVVDALTPGTEIILEYDMYVLSGFVQPFLRNATGASQAEFAVDTADVLGLGAWTQAYTKTDFSRGDSTLDFAPLEWGHFKATYTLGTETVTLDVNSMASTVTDFRGTSEFGSLFFTISSGADYLLDNVKLTYDGDPLPDPTSFTWKTNRLGDWNSSDNWSDAGFAPPSTAEHTATFTNTVNISGPTSVVTNDAQTVNRVVFDTADNPFAITGHGSIGMAATGAALDPTLEVVSGAIAIQVDVNLGANTAVTVADGATLDFNDQIDLAGNTLTLDDSGGLGTVNLRGSVIDSVGGGTVSNSGNLGTAGATSLAGNLTSTGTLDVDLGAGQSDSFHVSGIATLGGAVNVDLADGYTPSGDVTLLTADGGILLPSGLPTLTGANGYALSLAAGNTGLVLSAIPEPSTLLLVVLGLVVTAVAGRKARVCK
jgi:hypothetical protein